MAQVVMADRAEAAAEALLICIPQGGVRWTQETKTNHSLRALLVAAAGKVSIATN